MASCDHRGCTGYPESLTLDEAVATIIVRPDFIAVFRASGWDTRIGMWQEAILHWWFNVQPPERATYTSLDAWLRAIGARPVQGPFLLTHQEGKCVMTGPLAGLLAMNRSGNWPVEEWTYWLMVIEWWYQITLGDSSVHGSYPTLDAYLKSTGCRPGGTTGGGSGSGSGGGGGGGGGGNPLPGGLNMNTLLWAGVGLAALWMLGKR